MRGYDVSFVLNAICYKPFRDLKSLQVRTYYQKDLSIDFVTYLPLLVEQKSDSYDMIFVIIDNLMKLMYYKLVKTKIQITDQVRIIIDVIVKYYSLPELIISNQGSLFILKSQSLLDNFLGIKWRLSTAFYLQT